MEEIVTVGLGDRSYQIHVGTGTLPQLGTLCRAVGLGKRAAVITNPTVGALYLPQVKAFLESAGFGVLQFEVADGEQYKNSETLGFIYDRLIEGGLTRDGFVVALGGGVVGDMAGYAAATFLRGIPFVQVPTTLLAQVDSSVGGKTGINHPRGKNLIGAFHQPRLVLVDTDTLATLPEREYLAGLAEVVKYGVALDRTFFEFLEANTSLMLRRDPGLLRTIIARSCAIKAGVVEQDEREGGLRAVLNYGHTLGHAVETLTGYRQYLHGEAVAIGMAQAAHLSTSYGYASEADAARVVGLLTALKLPVALPVFPQSEYLDALLKDKKRRDQGLNFVFNRGIGGYTIATVSELDNLLVRCGIGG